MIKYFIRKTVFKNVDKESQDMLSELTSRYYVVFYLCYILFVFFCISPLIPLFIINMYEDVEFSVSTQIIIIAFIIILYTGLFVCMIVFKKATRIFFQMMIEELYFLVYTREGNAISKRDFETIKKVNKDLYFLVSTQNCMGYCFSVCFDICKAQKTGAIEFIAIQKTQFDKESENDDGRNFTMHVLYINNEWAFDTYSVRQYPTYKIHGIYKAKIYKQFNFDDISNKSYDEFKKEQYPELSKWSNANDCSLFPKKIKKDS